MHAYNLCRYRFHLKQAKQESNKIVIAGSLLYGISMLMIPQFYALGMW